MNALFLLPKPLLIALLHIQHLGLHLCHTNKCYRRSGIRSRSFCKLHDVHIFAGECDGLLHYIRVVRLFSFQFPLLIKCMCGIPKEHVPGDVHNEVNDKFALRHCNTYCFLRHEGLLIVGCGQSPLFFLPFDPHAILLFVILLHVLRLLLIYLWDGSQQETQGWWWGAFEKFKLMVGTLPCPMGFIPP